MTNVHIEDFAIDFNIGAQVPIDALKSKYGSFIVLLCTSEKDGATATFSVSKNANGFQIVRMTSQSGVNADNLDMGVNPRDTVLG
jgi:hypothetical protein